MNFTLKLQINSADELAKFLRDIDMELDLPFLNPSDINSPEGTIKELNQIIIDHSDIIHNLEKKLQDSQNSQMKLFKGLLEAKQTIKDLKATPEPKAKETIPSPQAEETIHFEPIHDANEVKPEILFEKPPKMIITTNKEVVICKVCGAIVPPSKKTPFCSPRCYNTNWAREHVSKKAKALQSKSD
jgi:endogenous inhibitor of DNA gyrase (YacG/DUF329 family)